VFNAWGEYILVINQPPLLLQKIGVLMRNSQRFSIALFSALAFSLTPCRLAGDEAKHPQADSTAYFMHEVFPVLQRHCLECHGVQKHEANLRLDGHQNLVDSGLIDSNNPDASELIRRIQLPADHAELMPAAGDRLTEKEINILRQWVANGATWPASFEAPKHWAYQQPVKAELTVSEDNLWIRTPIDLFV
jgi:mono/diheme cytochrome c family protein